MTHSDYEYLPFCYIVIYNNVIFTNNNIFIKLINIYDIFLNVSKNSKKVIKLSFPKFSKIKINNNKLY